MLHHAMPTHLRYAVLFIAIIKHHNYHSLSIMMAHIYVLKVNFLFFRNITNKHQPKTVIILIYIEFMIIAQYSFKDNFNVDN